MPPKTRNITDPRDLGHVASTRVAANGLTLVEVSQPHLHRGAVSVFFKAGSRFESASENGVSHFLEHMIFRGTEGYPTTYAQNFAVEQLGGMLFAATAPDATEFGITLPKETLADGVRLLATILTKPLFLDIDIERKVIAEEVLEDFDDQGRSIDIDFLSRSRLWPGHPLGQAIAGSLENIEQFTTAQIAEHFERTYVAHNAVVAITGGYDTDTLPSVVEACFSALPSGTSAPPMAPPTLAEGPTIHHCPKPGSQTQLRLAFHAPGEDDPSSVALGILLGVLDDGMSTRLHRRIFDELGLAYNVAAGMDAYSDVSAFNFDVTASHKNVAPVVRELLLLVRELKRAPVPEAELEKAKRRAVWSLDDFLDDPHGMAAWYGEQALFRRPPPLVSRRDAFLAVTGEDVQAAAKAVFCPQNLHITTVGAVSKRLRQAIEAAVKGFV